MRSELGCEMMLPKGTTEWAYLADKEEGHLSNAGYSHQVTRAQCTHGEVNFWLVNKGYIYGTHAGNHVHQGFDGDACFGLGLQSMSTQSVKLCQSSPFHGQSGHPADTSGLSYRQILFNASLVICCPSLLSLCQDTLMAADVAS